MNEWEQIKQERAMRPYKLHVVRDKITDEKVHLEKVYEGSQVSLTPGLYLAEVVKVGCGDD